LFDELPFKLQNNCPSMYENFSAFSIYDETLAEMSNACPYTAYNYTLHVVDHQGSLGVFT